MGDNRHFLVQSDRGSTQTTIARIKKMEIAQDHEDIEVKMCDVSYVYSKPPFKMLCLPTSRPRAFGRVTLSPAATSRNAMTSCNISKCPGLRHCHGPDREFQRRPQVHRCLGKITDTRTFRTAPRAASPTGRSCCHQRCPRSTVGSAVQFWTSPIHLLPHYFTAK
jgi:hypothetical protein